MRPQHGRWSDLFKYVCVDEYKDVYVCMYSRCLECILKCLYGFWSVRGILFA